MCGICGKFAFAEGTLSLESSGDEIARMCALLVHRGPDSQGIRTWDRAALGSRRLRVIDLETGDQPISNEDGSVWVVQNGEIYNYRHLRRSLEKAGHRFTTDSDTEVLVHLYEEFGPSFPEHCHGMFAACVYDRRLERLVLARDRVGKKPLFYHRDGAALSFSSELKPLLATCGGGPEVNKAAIAHFLIFSFVPTPMTAFRGFYQVEPGHVLIVDREGIASHQYWSPNGSKPDITSFRDAKEEYHALLTTCVEDRLVADVPVGLLLSGGMDSCSIASVLPQLQTSIPTFTVGLSDRLRDESGVARRVAKSIGAEHREIRVQAADVAETLPRLVWHLEQPFGDSSIIPTYLVAREARKHVTVVLTGDGGDECFGGYWNHVFSVWLDRLAWVPRPAWRLGAMAGRLNSRSADIARVFRWLGWTSEAALGDGLHTASYWLQRSTIGVQALASPALREEMEGAFSPVTARWAESEGEPYLNRILHSLSFKFQLPDQLLVKMDRATMATSLEARCPFLDHRMIEFAFRLPPRWKVRGLTPKWFPRAAMKGRLPEEILRKPKTGFGIPIRSWMQGDLQNMAWQLVLSERALSREHFDADRLRDLRRSSEAGKIDCTYLLYHLLVLELWYRLLVDDGVTELSDMGLSHLAGTP